MTFQIEAAMKWQESTMFAIDTETTGLDPEKDRIVELGACCAVHGITDDVAKGKPKLSEIATNFLSRIVGVDVLVGYNWPFDADMLSKGLGDHWTSVIEGKPVLDVLVLIRLPDVGKWWPGKGRHKLDAVAERLKIQRRGTAHRASSDAELAIRILQRFASHLPTDAHEASEYLARKRAEQDEEFQAWLATQEEQRP